MSRIRLQFLGLIFVACLISTSNARAEFSLTASPQTVGIGNSESVFLFVQSLNGGPLPQVDQLRIVLDGFAADPNIPTVNTPPWVGGSGLDVFSGGSSVFRPGGQLDLSIASALSPTEGAAVAELFFDTTGLSDGDVFEFGAVEGASYFGEYDALFGINPQLTFVVNVESIPEPSSAGLMFAMACGCMLRRKRT